MAPSNKQKYIHWPYLFFFFWILIIGSISSMIVWDRWKQASKPIQDKGYLIRIPIKGKVLPFNNGQEEGKVFELVRFEMWMDQMAQHPDIAAVLLEFDHEHTMEPVYVEEIIHIIQHFKAQSGKPVFAYGTSIDIMDWLIGTHVDLLLLDQDGSIEKGRVKTTLFIEQPLPLEQRRIKRLSPKFYDFSIGKKSENDYFYFLTNPSEEELKERKTYYAKLSEEFIIHLIELASSRKKRDQLLTKEYFSLPHYITFLDAASALEKGWVDLLVKSKNDALLKLQETNPYAGMMVWDEPSFPTTLPDFAPDEVALLFLQGEIIVEEPKAENSPTIYVPHVQALCDELIASKCKKVALYIETPGGSLVGSELLRKKLMEMRQQNIEIITTLKECYSGGTYILPELQEISSYTTTQTGSVGVKDTEIYFPPSLLPFLRFSASFVLREKELERPFLRNPLSKEEEEVRHRSSQVAYHVFIENLKGLASSRGKTFDLNCADGRPHSSFTAYKAGYIDNFMQDPLLEHIKKSFKTKGKIYPIGMQAILHGQRKIAA